MKIGIIGLSMLALFAMPAFAETGLFQPSVGVDVVYNKADLDTGFKKIAEDQYSSFNITLGNKFNRFVGMDLFYQQSLTEKGPLVTNQIDTGRLKTGFKAYGLDMTGYMPLSQSWTALVTVGAGHYNIKSKLFGVSEKENGTGLRIGLGAQYQISEHIAIRALIRHVKLHSIDAVNGLNEASIGARYTF